MGVMQIKLQQYWLVEEFRIGIDITVKAAIFDINRLSDCLDCLENVCENLLPQCVAVAKCPTFKFIDCNSIILSCLWQLLLLNEKKCSAFCLIEA